MGARQLTALGLAALLSIGAAAQDDQFLGVQISLDKSAFMRGATDPVADLNVRITLENKSRVIALTVPKPRMDPLGVVAFEMNMLGAPTGIKATEDTPEKTKILRDPALQPVGDRAETPGITIPPGGTKDITVKIGRYYAVKAAGKYDLTCVFQGQRSNTVEFEVLPIKRVDVNATVLLANIADYERGLPSYPFMFYITRGPGRFDTIVYLARQGKGRYEHYESHWLGKISTTKVPEMATQDAKVALVVPDKHNAAVSWQYVVNFGTKPITVKSKKAYHDAGMRPDVSFD